MATPKELIDSQTWYALWDAYGHVQIHLFDDQDQKVLFKQAVRSCSDKLVPMVSELAIDSWLVPLSWDNKEAAFDKMARELWGHIESEIQDEADVWEVSNRDK